MPGPVERWLETFMCKQYADTFEAYGFKTLQSVCQLQQPQLHAMGVAHEHIEKILESVHILRQSMFGGMNHYKDEGFGGQTNNRMQHTGYIQPPQAHNMGNMNYNMSQSGYNNSNHGNVAAHRGHMMDGMYQQQHSQPQQYPTFNNQNQGPYHMGQYNQQNSTYGPMTGYTNNQHRMQGHTPSAATHLHNRNQNPQEVANNILQMAASYQPSQTVQVPLNSKHRSAPYHVPVSAQYNMQGHGHNAEQVNRQFNYPNVSPHPHARTSPVSPGSMYMHSPASHHSSQSLPNSSPRSIHSPPGCGNIKSPVPTPSPAGSMRSPCHMQSPVNTPINQQLHISTGQQMVQSPPQQQLGYSPKNNPLSPPVMQSPQYKPQHGGPKNFVNDNVAGPATNFTANSPLQSLQKLCMLPDRQVVDPKSIVNDSSSEPNQNQKNVNSDVDTNNGSITTISATASVKDSSTDGNNCDNRLTDNNKNSLSSLEHNEEILTKIDSYPDDAVKVSAENNVNVEEDLENKKLKYLGQPCNTDSESPPSESVQKHEEKTGHFNQISEPKSDNNLCDSDYCKQNTEENINALTSEPSEKEISAVEELEKFSESSKENENTNQTEEKKQLIGQSCRQQENENKSVESTRSSDDLGENSDQREDILCREEVENHLEGANSDSEICDKSLVDGCENTLCDDQAKTDIDCRKDEVKSMFNGVDDDSDDISSDLDKPDIIIRKKTNSEIIEIKQDSATSKKKLKNPERSGNKRVLREIPARMASSSPYYVDASDSDDDGLLMVRKDVKYTYSRYQKIQQDIGTHISVSDNDIVISDEESLDRNSLDSDISKGFDCDLTIPHPKLSNGPGSNPGHKKKNTKLVKRKENKLVSDNPGHGSDNQRINRSKRQRIATSKYGDEMYLGDDFALDSEEENEIEKKSKRKRKVSGDSKSSVKIKSEEISVDSDEEIPTEKKGKKKCPNIKSITKVKSEPIAIDSEEEINVDESKKRKRKISGDTRSNVSIKLENEDSTNDPSDSRDICIDIIDSSDNLGDGSDIITFKHEPGNIKNASSLPPLPSTSKSQSESRPSGKKVKTQSKAKPKLPKGGKSKSRGKLLDDSIKNMKLKNTMKLMKQKGKKKPDVPVKEIGPFLRVKDSQTPKEKCIVVNQQIEDTSDKNSKSKKSAVRVSTVNVSKLPSEKSVHIPSPIVGENTSWVCALCNKHSSFKFLGDLFGPYYVEGNLPDDEGGTNPTDKKGKQKRQSLSSSVQTKTSKNKRKSKDNVKPQEVWVHEDCATWSDGVLLIGAKIYGLKEATDIACSTVCTGCKENGAMVGCLHKGCSQKFHYFCGIESGCYLDEENYSLLCPKHRDKRLKSVEAKSYKT